MIVFWIMTGLAAAMAGLLVLTGARRGADAAGADADVGGRELDELDRLKARGLLDETAHAAARAEAGRRLLAGQAVAAATPVAGRHDRFWVLGGIAATTAGALVLYVLTGSPGLPDQAYERRVDQWSTQLETLEPAQLAAVTARVARDNPQDRQALTMLGAARFAADDPLGAASAFRRLIELEPTDARAWARLGESLVRADDGRIGGDAEAAFRQAVNLDPDQLGARFFLGQAALERGDTTTTRAQWTPLIAALDPADPRRIDLERRLPADKAQ
ncbi:MAG: c-type cytochrome biogenesis protein CcmI [Phenylobacterium sp.]|jgi:cytochrome c-type biogenesis protein CcmH|uniref:C-type cytochrome biogenesis protein CcmI n=1 Tax=Brevundimonas mediterranea TaxID=74329 RepID=A0AB37E5H1_9CAUL|nr:MULTISPECIES: c-type cytochrome biogenesis protein CcmI [Brevundimonas]MDZ4374224.1 c-type cytochrome biogenesis protein CcmI [Phenylobacterium sp.]OYX80003.1 MAG: c-type cytochrome biogenesis protein CcmI [Brevundimonas sp. 32-68-21]EDX81438.1 cytochrome c-type biogenesis protein CcmI [Brevundimonas sp. BAL3]MBA4332169.1 c-type cytochrome biogenesis protein CcmI [Brevundimonas sp.]QIH72303.1 c-type cytochrome biogenesis protein CcmI [Brevundimonas mediterranea]